MAKWLYDSAMRRNVSHNHSIIEKQPGAEGGTILLKEMK